MQVKATLSNLRISPRKVRLVTDLIKGMDTGDALTELSLTVRRSSDPLFKLLESAVANAENNFGLDRHNLYVFDVQVATGPTIKRWMPRAYGRATPIMKRSSKIELILEERVEGKNRKSKEQLEKERKTREEAKKKMEAEIIKQREEETAGGKAPVKEDLSRGEDQRGKKGGGWMKRVFQRKSM